MSGVTALNVFLTWGLIVLPFAKSPNAPKSWNQMSAKGGGLLYSVYSTADNHNNCAFCEESMKFLPMLLHSIGFNFRCGGKLDLTSEVGHLGFSKMAAVFSFFQFLSFYFT